MKRIKAHAQTREPVFEYILSYLRFRRIIKMIPLNVELLDLGCGFNGSLLRRIGRYIKEGIGIDLNVNKKEKLKNIHLLKHDLNEKIPLENEKFDTVTSLALIEHLVNYEMHFAECYRVLKKGGFLILTTPAPKSKKILELLSKFGFISRREIEDHKKYFYLEELLNLAKKSGFSKVNGKRFQFGFNNLLIAKK